MVSLTLQACLSGIQIEKKCVPYHGQGILSPDYNIEQGIIFFPPTLKERQEGKGEAIPRFYPRGDIISIRMFREGIKHFILALYGEITTRPCYPRKNSKVPPLETWIQALGRMKDIALN